MRRIGIGLAVGGFAMVMGVPRELPAQAPPPLRAPVRVAQQPAAPAAGSGARPTAPPSAAPQNYAPPAAANGAPAGQNPQNWRQGAGPAPNAPPAQRPQTGPPEMVTVKPKMPFQLTPEEEQRVDETLKTWEQKSDKVSTFKCKFTRWDYDMAFGAPSLKYLKAEGKGEIKYKAPDHGKYIVKSMRDVELQVDGTAKMVDHDSAGLEQWVCDGDSIFEFKATEKKLIQHKLPEEMRGKSISDGPLPFIFGAKAEQIKRRYFVRLITPPELAGKEVWIEAWPRFQVDAANFQRVWIVLSAPEYRPEALQIFLPGPPNLPPLQCSRTGYKFEDQVYNDPFSTLKLDFVAPMTPPFWQKVVEEPPTADAPATAAPAKPAAGQAQRDAGAVKRR